MGDKGSLYVISAPSGTGKTTLVNALTGSSSTIVVSISHTTRPQRPGELHGVHYYFVTLDEFQQMIKQQEFLEYATIFDHLYGTSRTWVKETLAKGYDVILEIEWQGYEQIKKLFPEAIGIFILPPSLKDLQERLVRRQQDHPEIIRKRLLDVKEAVNHIYHYDYIVINDDFAHALHDLKTIFQARRLAECHQIHKYSHLIQQLATI